MLTLGGDRADAHQNEYTAEQLQAFDKLFMN
jgi:hypothetical protein